MLVELSKETEDEYFTILEIQRLIKDLSPADILRLGKIAKKYARNCLMDSDEILNESIIVIASGSRNFPRDVSLLAFLAGTMKSISSNERRKISKNFTPKDDQDNDFISNIADTNISIEDEATAKKEIEHIYDLFKDDEDVTFILMAKYDGLKPDEICETAGWDRTKYNSVQKRLRRGLNQRFPNGRKT